MPGRNKRTHFNFELGAAISGLEYPNLVRLAQSHIDRAVWALEEGDRAATKARLRAATEALNECRRRGEQLRLRI